MKRPKLTITRARPLHLAAGALMLTVPGSALVLSAQPSSAATSVQLRIASSRVRFGQRSSLSGSAGPQWAGQPVEIELQPAGGRKPLPLRRVIARADGSFATTLRLRSSGELRAVAVDGSGSGQQANLTPPSAAATPAPSQPQPVWVGARLAVRRRQLAIAGAEDPAVEGRLSPAGGHRLIVLLGRRHDRWVRLAQARTRPSGRFVLRLPRSLSGTTPLRVRFPGDRLNGRASAPAGRVVAYRAAVASWYEDAGNTACGFHAVYGVANVSLPCGTRVRFRYGGRALTATVDDRGPYVAGRTWDLNQNTAAALGFSGVGTVWYSD